MKRLIASQRPSWRLAEELHRHPRRIFLSTKAPSQQPSGQTSTQAIPLGPYYESVLNNPQPIPDEKPEEPPASSTTEEPKPETEKPKGTRGRKPKESSPSSPATSNRKPKATATPLSPQPSLETSPPVLTPPPSSVEDRARVVFGSRLAGPAERAERLAEMRSRSTVIAGVLVPPRPEEPDNCCMSGCVNCVWDRYRDDMEGWAHAQSKAERRLLGREAGISEATTAPATAGVGQSQPPDGAVDGMDDDGGGSETNWAGSATDGKLVKDFWDEELYKNVPVGIREFMKQEKRLKLKHELEGSAGG